MEFLFLLMVVLFVLLVLLAIMTVAGHAMWLMVAVLASTGLSARIPYATWRNLHFLSFPAYALASALLATIPYVSAAAGALLVVWALRGQNALWTDGGFWIATGERTPTNSDTMRPTAGRRRAPP